MKFLATVSFLLASSVTCASTFDVVVASKTCAESSLQQIDCEFRVGKDLRFTIAGLGQRDTGVTVMKANIDGDYYATFGLAHQCFVIKPGAKTGTLDFAFVSPRTAKVFKTWQQCQNE